MKPTKSYFVTKKLKRYQKTVLPEKSKYLLHRNIDFAEIEIENIYT